MFPFPLWKTESTNNYSGGRLKEIKYVKCMSFTYLNPIKKKFLFLIDNSLAHNTLQLYNSFLSVFSFIAKPLKSWYLFAYCAHCTHGLIFNCFLLSPSFCAQS